MRQVIEMEHPAVAFIQQHGGVVTVRRSPRHGCCGGTAHIAVAELGAPSDTSAFEYHQLPEGGLWIEPSIAWQGLRLRVEGWWKLRRLFLDGAPLTPGSRDTQQR